MKNVVLLVGMLSMVGCAVGSNDPTGDDNLGTEQGGGAAGQPSAGTGAASGNTSGSTQPGVVGHTNVLDPTPQIIPNRPGHGPATPEPGPVHIGPVVPR